MLRLHYWRPYLVKMVLVLLHLQCSADLRRYRIQSLPIRSHFAGPTFVKVLRKITPNYLEMRMWYEFPYVALIFVPDIKLMAS